jgi:hypothetical protein
MHIMHRTFIEDKSIKTFILAREGHDIKVSVSFRKRYCDFDIMYFLYTMLLSTINISIHIYIYIYISR